MKIDASRASCVCAAVDEEPAAFEGLRPWEHVDRKSMIAPCSAWCQAVPTIRPHLRGLHPVFSGWNWTRAALMLPHGGIVETARVCCST